MSCEGAATTSPLTAGNVICNRLWNKKIILLQSTSLGTAFIQITDILYLNCRQYAFAEPLRFQNQAYLYGLFVRTPNNLQKASEQLLSTYV